MPSGRKKSTGLFITLEGGEGSGKTTQAAKLCAWLAGEGWNVLHTREPGGTPVAEQLRNILLNRSLESIQSETEALLILAARRQHVEHVIKPALERGMTVVCDRFADSTIAYQGYGRGLDRRMLNTMNAWATGKLVPDLTLLFDVPVSVGLARRRGHASTQNRLDQETERFHKRVHSGFQALARREPRRILTVDATVSPDAVEQTVQQLITHWLKTHPTKRSRPR